MSNSNWEEEDGEAKSRNCETNIIVEYHFEFTSTKAIKVGDEILYD